MTNPKQLFLNSLSADSKFRNIIRSTEMESAIAFSLAQLALDNPSAEEMRGVNRFIAILSNIGEPDRAPKRIPDKRLNYDLLEGSSQPPQTIPNKPQ